MNGLSAANHVQIYVRWLKLAKTMEYIYTQLIAIKFKTS